MNKEIEIDIIQEVKEIDIEIIEEPGEKEIFLETENIEVKVVNGEKYRGKYIVYPEAYYQQELETKNKILEKNMIIKEIPFFEVSNEEGTTVYIGSEV